LTRGGKRDGSGRPPGIRTAKTEKYFERCTPEKKEYLKKCSEEYDKKEIKE